MTRSSIGCLNLFDTSLLVRSDHYCKRCGVYFKCFSLSGNGLRHLAIHVLDADSDIYAAANNISPEHYQPARSYGSEGINCSNSPSSGSPISICAALSCTNHTVSAPRSLRYCSKVCFESDNATVSARSNLVRDVSVVTPKLVSWGAHAVSQTPSMPVTPGLSSVVQQAYTPLPNDTCQVYSATRQRVSHQCSWSDISDSDTKNGFDLELGSASSGTDSDTYSTTHADWTRPDNRFGTDNEDAMADYEAECLSLKRKAPSLANEASHKCTFTRGEAVHNQRHCLNCSATASGFTSAFHARTDATALETTGRQDSCHKASNDNAAAAASSSSSVRKLTQARGHEYFARWKQALEAYACSIPMGPKILDGDPLLASVLSAQPHTHDIPHDSGGKVAICNSLSDIDKEAANAYNNWIVLAQRASNATSKIHYHIFNTVDEPIRDMICPHCGDGRVAYEVISLMINKPSRMLQRRLEARLFSGSFSAAKSIDILISQIKELQAKVNFMGMPPSIATILSKVDDARAQILAMQSSQVRPRA